MGITASPLGCADLNITASATAYIQYRIKKLSCQVYLCKEIRDFFLFYLLSIYFETIQTCILAKYK